jgi:GT2 family glycosyltransferase
MTPQLTIQIPTFRNPEQLKDALLSLLVHTEFPYVIKVINNDQSREVVDEVVRVVGGYDLLPSAVDCIEVIHAGGNQGWMGAHNLALKQCDTPFVCFLNDDVVFIPRQWDFWKKLIEPFGDPTVGATGPCSNFVMGSQNLWNIMHPVRYDTTLLIGFCVVMRTELIKELGGLDETLPGGDDFDSSIRIRDAGYRLVVDRAVYLHHLGRQTGIRVHGEWDGVVHKENTVNAIIRKHGVKKWYDTMQAKVLRPEAA